jgi:hypothetical protein
MIRLRQFAWGMLMSLMVIGSLALLPILLITDEIPFL